MDEKVVDSNSYDTLIFDGSKKKAEKGEVQHQIRDDANVTEVKKHVFRFSEKRVEMLKEMYSEVVVRDFGDDYHMSDAEREKEYDLYKEFAKIQRHKTKYRNIADFIFAMRECLDLLMKMSIKNAIFMDLDEHEFMRRVLAGEIQVAQFQFPRYVGSDRKDLNWKFVRDYIVDPDKDPYELVKKHEIEYLEGEAAEDPEAYMERVFSPEQLAIMKAEINPNKYDEADKDYMSSVLPLKKKDLRKTVKVLTDLGRPLKDMVKNQEQERGALQYQSYLYEANSEAMDKMAKLDRKRGYISSDEMPKFHGDIMDKAAYKKYLYELNEWHLTHDKVPYNGKYVSREDANTYQVLDYLDENGVDIKKFYRDKAEEKRLKRQSALDDEKEKRLRKRLTEIQRRKDQRKDAENGMINTKVKKKSKKKAKKIKVTEENGVETWEWNS